MVTETERGDMGVVIVVMMVMATGRQKCDQVWKTIGVLAGACVEVCVGG